MVRSKKKPYLNEIQKKISEECDRIKALLLRKNREYGNSILEPIRIFSQSTSMIEQIKVRIDDKLSRTANTSKKTIKEDTVTDLIGYLIFYNIATKKEYETDREEEYAE